VQIDIDPRMIGLRYPNELNLIGDARLTLQRLLPMLERKADRSWQEHIKDEITRWWRLLEDRAHEPAHPINPQYAIWALSERVPSTALVVADTGSITTWYARDLKFRGEMRGSVSGGLATMGNGVPYAFAAKMAYPDRPVIALVGDGAMQMNGNNELLTIAKYWREWSDPRLVVMVSHNNDLNMVTWEMRSLAGNPKFRPSQDLPEFNYARYAELAGLHGILVEKEDEVGPAWDEALAADRPVVLDVITDPEVPPLPPHVTVEQALALTEAMLKGDPGTPDILRHGFKEKLAEFLPGR
jgi:pyruvate dehydrogenase (quinone)